MKSPRKSHLAIGFAVWLAIPGASIHSATISWANAGTDFSTGSSWTGGNAPADSLTADIAAFATAAPTFLPNLASDRSVAGVAFVNGAGAFTFSGAGTLSIGASGIVNSDNSAQTLSVPIKLGVASVFTTASSGALAISGPVDTNGLVLTLNGAGSGASSVAGAIGGSGSITKSGSGTWTLSGANTFSGGLTLTAGTLSLGSNSALGLGTLTINGVSTLSAASARTLANAVDLGANATISGAQAISFQSAINLTGDRTLTVTSTALTTLEAGITETGGARAFTKAGAGSLLVKSSLGNTGSTTLSAGTLLLDTGVTLSPANFSMAGGAFAASGSISRAIGAGDRQIQFGAGALGFIAYNGALTLTFGGGEIWGSTAGFFQNSTLTLNSAAATNVVTLASDFSLGAATRTITVTDNTLLATDSAAITGSLDGAGGLIKNGTGLLALSGTNTYLGATTLSAGTLRAQGAASLGAGALAINGGTLQLAGDGDTAFGRDTTLAAAATLTVDRLTAGPGVTHTLGTLSVGTFALTLSPGTLVATNTDYGLVFGAATLTGNPTFTINKNGTGNGTLTLGALSDGGAARTLIKTGAGTLVLSSPSAAWTTPGDALRINNGTVRAAASDVLGTVADITLNATAANATALLDLNGNDLAAASITFGGGATKTSANNLSTGAGTLTLGGGITFIATGNPLGSTLSGNLALTTAHIFNIGDSTTAANDLTISALISGTAAGFTKTGAGTLVLSGWNTYSGQTQVQSGALSINSLGNVAGGPSALGNPADALAGTIALGSGTSAATLTYTGAATASDRALDLAGTTGGATINASGTGPLTLSGSITASGAGAKTLTLGGTHTGANTFSGILADSDGGATSLIKTGTGNWVLGGLSTYTGQTQIQSGALGINSLGSLGTGPSALGNPSTISTGAIALGSLTNTVTLTYAGPATLSNRPLDLAGTTGAITLAVTGTGALTLTGGVTASGAGSKTLTLNAANVDENELGGIIADNSPANKTSISKTGAGTWKLSGINTYSGATTLTAGTLVAGNDAAFGTGTLALGGGTLRGDGTARILANNISLTATGVTIGGASALTFGGTLTNALAGNPTLNFTNTAATTFTAINLSNTAANRTVVLSIANDVLVTGAIANGGTSTASSLTKSGAGKLTLSGVNTYAGVTTLTAGTLRATTSPAALGAGTLSLGGGILELANDTGLAFNRNTSITASATIKVDRLTSGAGVIHALGNLSASASTLTVQPGALVLADTPYGLAFGNLSLSANPFTLNVANNGSAPGTVAFASLTNSAAVGLVLNGPGTVTFNTASGVVTSGTPLAINRGILRLNASGALGASALANVTVNATAAGETALLDLNGYSQSLLNLTLGGATATATSTNNISTGTGILTLGGNVTFTSTNNPLGSTLSGNLALASGSRTFTINDSANAAIDLEISAVVSGAGGLIKAGAGRLDLSGANTYSGATTLSAGTLRATTNPSALGLGALTLGAGTLELAGDSDIGFGNSASITASSTIKVDRLTSGAGVTHSLGSLSTGTFALSVQPGSLVSSDSPYGLVFGATSLAGNPFTLNVANNGSASGTVTLGMLSNTAAHGLTLSGLGTVALSSASGSIFSATPFLVNRGTLRLDASNALGASALANVTVNATAAGETALLDLNGNSQSLLNLTLGGTTATATSTNNISTGDGVLTLGGAVTFTGNPLGSTLSGNLSLDTGSHAFTIGNSANAATDLDIPAAIGGAGGLTKAGAGTLRLAGSSTYSGGTTLSAGTLVAASDTALGSGTLTFAAASTLRGDGTPLALANSIDLAVTGAILGGSSALTFNAGTLTNTLAGNPTLSITNTGGTSFNAVNLSNSAANRVITFAAAGDAAITGIIADGGGSTASGLIKSGTGKLTLSGANTYHGATTLSAGTLRAATNPAALGLGALSLGAGTLELAGDSDIAFNNATTVTAAAAIKIDRLTAGPGVTHSLGSLTTGTFALSVQPGALVAADTPYGLAFGATTLAGNPFTLNVANNGSASGTLTLGMLSNSAARGLTLTGLGTVILGAPAGTLTAGTPVAVNGGTLDLGADNALGSGAVVALTINNLLGSYSLFDFGGHSQSLLSVTLGGAGATSSSSNNISTGAGTLTLGGTVTFTSTNNPLGSTISGNLALGAAARTFAVNDSASAPADLLVSAAVSGTGGLIKTGAGLLDLTGGNTYSGTTTLSAGTIGIGSDSAFGISTLSLASGALTATGGDRTLTNNLAFTSGSAIAFTGTQSLTFNGNATLAGTDTLTNSTTVTLGGVISGSGKLVHNGTGTLILNGTNTFSGSTTVNGGTVRANAPGALGATGSVTVGPGGLLELGTSNTVNNGAAITLSGGTILRDGGVSETFGNLNLTAASTIDFGTGADGTLRFGTYTPTHLLTVSNFSGSDTLIFGSNLTSSISNSSFFDFGSSSISSVWNNGASTFTVTITPVPEPTSMAAGAIMLGVLLWPQRRRLAWLWSRR